ncbi:MFS transporter [Escherichia coli]|nr:MFS transporter [Escherichia coli]
MGTLYALSDIPFWSMTSVMTDNPQERTKAATCAMLGVNAGIGELCCYFLSSVVVWLVTVTIKAIWPVWHS